MKKRETTANQHLPDWARGYSFFQLAEQLNRKHEDNPETLCETTPMQPRFRFKTDPSLGFSASEVSAFVVHEAANETRYDIQVTFLGIHGAASPLPSYYLEDIAYEHTQKIGVKPAFFNFFNHRLVTLVYRIWRKYRYYIRYRNNGEDPFSKVVMSFIGLNDRNYHEATSEVGKSAVNWSKLLPYAGMLASRSRASGVIEGIIAHYFGLALVEVLTFQPKYVDVPDFQKNALGVNTELGGNFVLGERVMTHANKFVISIANLPQEEFMTFLPRGENHAALKELVRFLLRDQLAYDLRLSMVQEDIPPMKLDNNAGALLGWTSFVGKTAIGQATPTEMAMQL